MPRTDAVLTVLDPIGGHQVFSTPHGDPLFLLVHLADFVHQATGRRDRLVLDAYRAYAGANPGTLPAREVRRPKPNDFAYRYRLTLPGDDTTSGSGLDGLRVDIAARRGAHPLLGRLDEPIGGPAGLYEAAARCCTALAADLAEGLAVHTAGDRHRRVVEFLEPAWWHAHAATLQGWADTARHLRQPNASLADRDRRRQQLLGAAAIEASRRDVRAAITEVSEMLPAGWAARPVQQLPRALYGLAVIPGPPLPVQVTLHPPHAGLGWSVHLYDTRTGVGSATFAAGGAHVATYPTAPAAAHAAITAAATLAAEAGRR